MVPSLFKKLSGDDTWLLEFLAILGCLICFAGMVILLAFYDNKEIFHWHDVTLNALVSVLSTATQAGLMMVVAESISQWKWIFFSSERRRLIDFATLDSASRGPLGSMKLLWSVRGSTVVWLGALTTIFSIAFDPFLQQLIQYESRLVYQNDSLVTIPRAQRYAKGNELFAGFDFWGELSVSTDTDFAMQSAIFYGLAEPMNSTTQQLSFSCPSGNCQWPSYDSLAVCSVCNNLTQRLVEAHGNGGILFDSLAKDNAVSLDTERTNYTLPNGLYIDNLDGVGFGWAFGPGEGITIMTTFSTGNATQTNSMKEIDTLIVATSLLQVLQDPHNAYAVWPDLPIEATECAIYYCVNHYNSSVVNGTLQEKVTPVTDAHRSPDSWQATVPEGVNYEGVSLNGSRVTSLEFDSQWSTFDRTDLMLGDGFNVSQMAVDSISNYFQSLFSANLSDAGVSMINGYMLNSTNLNFNGNAIKYSPTTIQALYYSSNLSDTFKTLATSMTNAIRAGDDTGRTSSGTNGTSTTFYSIKWPWISLSGIVMIAGVVHLIATVFQANRMGVVVWKSNLIAVLSRGQYVTELLEGLGSVSAMNERAEKQSVNLFPDYGHVVLDNGSAVPLRPLRDERDERDERYEPEES